MNANTPLIDRATLDLQRAVRVDPDATFEVLVEFVDMRLSSHTITQLVDIVARGGYPPIPRCTCTCAAWVEYQFTEQMIADAVNEVPFGQLKGALQVVLEHYGVEGILPL